MQEELERVLTSSFESSDQPHKSQLTEQLKALQERDWAGYVHNLAKFKSSDTGPSALASVLLSKVLKADEARANYSKQTKAWRDELRGLIRQHPRAAAKVLRLDIDLFDDQSLLSQWVALAKGVEVNDDNLVSFSNLLKMLTDFFEDGPLPIQLLDGNLLLTLIVANSMRLLTAEQHYDPLLLSLAETLGAMLPFIGQNMAMPSECRHILLCIVKLGGSKNVAVRAFGIHALTRVATLYYEVLMPVMHAVFPVLSEILQAQANEADQMAVLEFWHTIAEIEYEQEVEQKITQLASAHLLRLLFPLLSWHDSGDDGSQLTSDPSETNQRIAALGLLKQLILTIPTSLDAALEYFTTKVTSEEWAVRGACCDIIFAITKNEELIDKSSEDTALVDKLASLSPTLFELAINEKTLYVQEAATSALAELCAWAATLPRAISTALVNFLLTSLQATPVREELVRPLCWGVGQLCQVLFSSELADDADDDNENTSRPLKADDLFTGRYEKIAEIGMVLLHRVPSARPIIVDMIVWLIRILPASQEHLITILIGMYGSTIQSITSSDVDKLTTESLWPLGPALAFLGSLCQKPTIATNGTDYGTPSIGLAIRAIEFCRSQQIREKPELAEIAAECIPDAMLIIGAVLSQRPVTTDAQFECVATICLAFLSDKQSNTSTIHTALSVLSDLCLSTDGERCPAAKANICRLTSSLLNDPNIEFTCKPPALNLLGDLLLNWSGDLKEFLPVLARTFIQALEACVGLWRSRTEEDANRLDVTAELTESVAQAISSLVLTHKVVPAVLRPLQTLVNVCTKSVEIAIEEEAVPQEIGKATIKKLLHTFLDLTAAFQASSAAPAVTSVTIDPSLISPKLQYRLKHAGLTAQLSKAKPECEDQAETEDA